VLTVTAPVKEFCPAKMAIPWPSFIRPVVVPDQTFVWLIVPGAATNVRAKFAPAIVPLRVNVPVPKFVRRDAATSVIGPK
jgi:hypothetical protein